MYIVLIGVLIFIFLMYYFTSTNYETFVGKRDILNSHYNLLTNSSFQNGKDIKNAFIEGDGSIIRLDKNPNCDVSQYVLKLNKNAIYNIPANVKKNYNYKITLWTTSVDKNLVKIYSNNNQISLEKNMFIDKKILNNNTWYLLYITFVSNSDTILLKINNTYNNEIYLTDITLLPYLKYLPNFGATIGLETFLDASNQYSCSNGTGILWNDLSNNAFTYKWISKPTWNSDDGYFKTKNNTLVGPSSLDVLNTTDEFTIIIRAKSNSSPDGLVGGTNSVSIPGSPGSMGNAIRLDIPNNYGKLRLTINGQALMREDDESIRPNDTNVYTITYKNNTARIWINESLFQTYTNVVRPYFSQYPIKINGVVKLLGDKKIELPRWDANLYAFMIYSKELNQNEIEYINYYLVYHPAQTLLVDVEPTKSMDIIPAGTKPMDVVPKPSAIVNGCPTVSIENGEYIVYVPKDSKYSQIVGYGKRSYGPKKETAHHIYKTNFPDCPMPTLLRFDRVPHNVCPYIIAKNNPCSTEECKNVDWTKDDINKMGMTEGCRRNVSYYCHKNRYIDPNCKCWKESNKYNLECQKMRKEYEPPEDYGFTINIFDIEEHPDMKNYVRKNKIPCWNCNLMSPDGGRDATETRNWSNIKNLV